MTKALDLLRLCTKDKDVLPPNLLPNLNIGAIQRAQNQPTVQHKLHVARARRLRSRRRNVLRNVAGGNDQLGERHGVVGDEDDLEVVARVNVVVDDRLDAVDELDDELGDVVAGGCLAAKDDDAGEGRLALGGGHALELDVAVNDAKMMGMG